jgi:hypothetical protein
LKIPKGQSEVVNRRKQTIQWPKEKKINNDKSLMRKRPGNVYDKWNISVVICDTDIP